MEPFTQKLSNKRLYIRDAVRNTLGWTPSQKIIIKVQPQDNVLMIKAVNGNMQDCIEEISRFRWELEEFLGFDIIGIIKKKNKKK